MGEPVEKGQAYIRQVAIVQDTRVKSLFFKMCPICIWLANQRICSTVNLSGLQSDVIQALTKHIVLFCALHLRYS